MHHAGEQILPHYDGSDITKIILCFPTDPIFSGCETVTIGYLLLANGKHAHNNKINCMKIKNLS